MTTNSVLAYACPACGAARHVPCDVRLDGIDTSGWSHDARIMRPIYEAVRELRTASPPNVSNPPGEQAPR